MIPPSPPRTVAVALQGAEGPLPKVVASGYGEVAQAILELAFANGVKVREDADLAQILAAVDVGENIPLEALHVVSEILARVYAANNKVYTAPNT